MTELPILTVDRVQFEGACGRVWFTQMPDDEFKFYSSDLFEMSLTSGAVGRALIKERHGIKWLRQLYDARGELPDLPNEQTMSPTATDYIPTDSEVQTTAGGKGWRIADGKLRRGREIDGTLETRDKIIGRLLRVGIASGTGDDGTEWEVAECDLLTANGVESVKANTNSITQTIGLIRGLLEFKKDELLLIEPNKATKPTKYGNFVTYCNIYRVDAITRQATRLQFERSELDLEDWMDKFKEHPCYADRPKRDEAYPWADFEKALAEKGWPDIGIAGSQYLTMAQKLGSPQAKALDEVSAETWAKMCPMVRSADKPPKAIQAVIDSMPKDEYNPFLDE